ncbi:TasA family protein [Lentibacillus sp. CBA3610]|uniref:TasA family protein n=1 Tax=Lentibacillus sp. CBA3610 TaxID=2518176 RepID=UPI0015959E53|nr:TasA family protein [Lentibacillus sp. CBA3610]QKY68985.1 hypothetical protein Len3610_04580 [Lentibacillus sp. CBA3610]
MKRMVCFICLLAVFSPVFLSEGSQSAAAQSNAVIDINVKPEDYLFDLTNMKPGDWAPRTIKVQNNGTNAFEYVTTFKNNGGSEKLFRELLLEVTDSDNALYTGKLTNFNGLSPRYLSASSEEELTFTIRFPEHLGNEFQGLETNILLTFQAAGNTDTDQAFSGGTVGGGSPLPDTATDKFTYLLIGIALMTVGGIIYFLYRIRQNYQKNLGVLDITKSISSKDER